MSPADSRSWFVVQTRPHQEEKAVVNLERQGFVAYLPRYLRRCRHARRTETVSRPLYPRYVFVGLKAAEQRWQAINSTFGVARLVCRGEQPAPVDEAVVRGLREREGEDGLIRLEPAGRLARGDAVRVLDGAFARCLGLFEEIADHDRVAILLDLLGRKVRVLIEEEAIEPAR